MDVVKEERKFIFVLLRTFIGHCGRKHLWSILCSQNIQTVQRGSSGVCCVQCALLSLLWSYGERSIKGHN